MANIERANKKKKTCWNYSHTVLRARPYKMTIKLQCRWKNRQQQQQQHQLLSQVIAKKTVRHILDITNCAELLLELKSNYDRTYMTMTQHTVYFSFFLLFLSFYTVAVYCFFFTKSFFYLFKQFFSLSLILLSFAELFFLFYSIFSLLHSIFSFFFHLFTSQFQFSVSFFLLIIHFFPFFWSHFTRLAWTHSKWVR